MSQINKFFSEVCNMAGKIAQANASHINNILDIEHDCRDTWNNLNEDAGGKDYYMACLKDSKFYVYMEGRLVLGFIIFNWDPVERQIVIDQLMVRPDFRRIKIGTKLISLIGEFKPNLVEVTVVDTNLTAQLFLRARGYKCVKILKKKFLDECGNNNRTGYHFTKTTTEAVSNAA